MHIMRVFFPDYAIKVKSGICIGWVDYQVHTICVLAVVHLQSDFQQILKKLQKSTCVRQQPLVLLGPLTHLTDPERDKILQLCHTVGDGPCVELTRPDTYSLPTCTLIKDSRQQDYHFILYNQSKVLACCLPKKEAEPCGRLSTQPSLSACGDVTDKDERSVLRVESVLSVIQEGVRQLCALNDVTDWDVSIDVKMQDNGRSSAIQRLPAYLLWVFLSAIKFSLVPFRCHFCNRLSQSTVFQTLLRFTQTGCEIQNKYNNLQSLLNKHSVEATDEHRQEFTEEVKTRNKSKTRCEDLRSGNLLAFLLIDSLLGVLLMWWIQHNNWPDIWADWTISSANTTAESLQKLLQWLMGAPAGLKLNSALAHFLGQFFLYHVYLWIGYLAVMQPVLGWAIWYMSLTGCLGVSVILAVTSDMVSMLTFHIYCFYVYAARLYCLQVTGLLALSRLFRGKKWNVLRKRVDTCNYDVDQLFIGTLLFTILLFLLPTTALFYAVFTGLRLVIIALKGVLTKTTEVLKRVPAYSILLCLTGSDMLLSGVQFDLVDQPGEGCSNALVMEVQHMGMYDTLQLSYQDVTTKKSSHQQQTRNPILALGSDLISGHLIYPWGLKHLQNV